MALGGSFVKLINRIAVPSTKIKPDKQLTAVKMIALLLIALLLIELLLIELLLCWFGCRENGGSIGCDSVLKVGKGKGVDVEALAGIESGICEAARLGILIRRRQLGQRIELRGPFGTRLRVPQIQSTNIAGVLPTVRIGLLASFGIVTHRLASGLANGTSTEALHPTHRIFVPRR